MGIIKKGRKKIGGVIVDLSEIDGASLRRISHTDKNKTNPAITITTELKDIGLKVNDWVIVRIVDDAIAISKPK